MAEDDSLSQSNPASGLSTDDITPNVYEGGFKTWECAMDLASHLSESLSKGWELGGRSVHIIEVPQAWYNMTLRLFDAYQWFVVGGRRHSSPNARFVRLLA